jgi:hypothetical protein
VIVVLIVLAMALLQLHEDWVSGWLRLSSILGIGIGWCLFAFVAAFSVNRLRRRRPGIAFSRCVWAACIVACSWVVILTARDFRRAIDPNQWIEVKRESIRLPFTINAKEIYYTLDLSSTNTDGLKEIEPPRDDGRLWPDNSTRADLWFGWLCSIRNRGMHSLTNVTFDIEVDPFRYSPVIRHHVRLPSLASNQSVNLLLATDNHRAGFRVIKPDEASATVEGSQTRQILKITWVRIHDFQDDDEFLYVGGPD